MNKTILIALFGIFSISRVLASGVIGNPSEQVSSTNHNTNDMTWMPLSDVSDYHKAVFYPQTKYPAKNWVFGTTSTKDHNFVFLHLLNATTFQDVVPPLKVNLLFAESDYYDRHTIAVWSPSEDFVAISTGARKWADVYLFRLRNGRLTQIATPDKFSVIKKMDSSFTREHLTWIAHPMWLDHQTMRVIYEGNAYVPSDYKRGEIINGLADFNFTALWRIIDNRAIWIASQ